MAIALDRIIVPTYLRGLSVLARYVDKASTHVATNGLADDAIVQARLAPDMLTFAGQVQRASDTAKGGIARLLGIDAPRFEDSETTLAELKARIEKTIAFVAAADRAGIAAAEDREITLTAGSLERRFDGVGYAIDFAVPNFDFHVAVAHAILRHAGVTVGKLDYLGATT